MRPPRSNACGRNGKVEGSVGLDPPTPAPSLSLGPAHPSLALGPSPPFPAHFPDTLHKLLAHLLERACCTASDNRHFAILILLDLEHLGRPVRNPSMSLRTLSELAARPGCISSLSARRRSICCCISVRRRVPNRSWVVAQLCRLVGRQFQILPHMVTEALLDLPAETPASAVSLCALMLSRC